MLREALRVKLSAGPAMGARRGRQDLSAGSGESREACEQGSDLVRRRIEEVRLAPKSPANVPLPPRHLQALVSIRPHRPLAPLWPGPLPATSQRPRPALAFLPAHPPHLTAKSTLLPSRGGSAVSGPQGQEPNLARTQTSPPPVPCSLSTALCCQGCKHLPPRGSPWVTACQRQGLAAEALPLGHLTPPGAA